MTILNCPAYCIVYGAPQGTDFPVTDDPGSPWECLGWSDPAAGGRIVFTEELNPNVAEAEGKTLDLTIYIPHGEGDMIRSGLRNVLIENGGFSLPDHL